jgi:osmotically-inducible protein OsmY
MKSDSDIKRTIEAELKLSPEVGRMDIAVKVSGGEVTLTGFARSYFEKYQAEIAARRLKGVAAVANDISVRPLAGISRNPEIARLWRHSSFTCR